MNEIGCVATASVLLLGLSGCNNVVSVDPWFTAADAEGLPAFRDGLWVSADPDCRFDEAKPAERWPDCASASFVRGDESWSMRWEDTDERGRRRRTFAGWERDDSVIASGEPLIGQFEMKPEQGEQGDKLETELEANVLPSDDADVGASEQELPWRFLYFAIRPVRYDEAGKVTAAETWAIQCGPLPVPERSETAQRRKRARRDEPEEAVASVTDRPFPGLTVIESNCVAESIEALRQAARLSESLEKHGESRWVRDGWR